MEFDFNLNELFREQVTVLDKAAVATLSRPGGLSLRLSQVLDKLGDASAKAQGLPAAITTVFKLLHSDHKVYLLKDETANSGHGAAVGYIRVGHKKLFVFDHQSRQHEVEPLCVLDFYVHESKQRQGHGKQLFEAMLQAENVKPCHLAIDRPSAKFVSFLLKHYGLRQTVQQVNNFAVFEGFFVNRPDAGRKFGRSGLRILEVDASERSRSELLLSAGKDRATVSTQQHTSAIASAALKAAQVSPSHLGQQAANGSHQGAGESGLLKNVRLPRPSWDLSDAAHDRVNDQATANKSAAGLRAGGDGPVSQSAQANAYSRHQASHSAPVLSSPAGRPTNSSTAAEYHEPLRNRDGQLRADTSAMAAATATLNAQRDACDSRGRLRLQPLGVEEHSTAPLSRDRKDPVDRSPKQSAAAYAGAHVLSAGPSHHAVSSRSAVGQTQKRAQDTTWSLFGVPSAVNFSSAQKYQLTRPF